DRPLGVGRREVRVVEECDLAVRLDGLLLSRLGCGDGHRWAPCVVGDRSSAAAVSATTGLVSRPIPVISMPTLSPGPIPTAPSAPIQRMSQGRIVAYFVASTMKS